MAPLSEFIWAEEECGSRLPESAITECLLLPSPTSPETGGEASAGSHLCRRCSARFPKDVMKFNVWLLRDCGHFRKEEGRGNILLGDPTGHTVKFLKCQEKESQKLYSLPV